MKLPVVPTFGSEAPRVRSRLLLAAILPAALVAITLAAFLLNHQYRSLDRALTTRVANEARQLARAAEFGVFTGSSDTLQNLVVATQLGDSDILAVYIIDAKGNLLASAGTRTFKVVPEMPPIDRTFQSGDITIAESLVKRTHLAVDDIYSGVVERLPDQSDGLVVLEISRRNLQIDQLQQVIAGIGISAIGIILGALFALRISVGVTRPILRISDVVDRIGQGDLQARVEPDSARVMPALETGINAMAVRVGLAQEYLVQMIDDATAKMRERAAEAEQANAAKTRFLASASHDLRQPLHALGLFVSRLTTRRLEPESVLLVNQIETSVQALQELLDMLLDISRLDAKQVNPNLSDFPLRGLFASLDREFSASAAEKGLILRVRPNDIWLQSDEQLLKRILMNFVSNAIRYTSQGGILLGCRRRGEYARIEVWDTGIGIAREQIQDIFGEYVQLANPERNRAKGLGLGLSICERLAKLLKLPLGVQSRVGRGSVFWIDVPLGIAAREPMTKASIPAESVQLSGTVVIISRDRQVVASMMNLLENWGCSVIGAESADDAIARCNDMGIIPDVAISDYYLGNDDNGVLAGLHLRRQFASIAIVLLTGSGDNHVAAEAAQHNFELFIKPVRPSKIRAIVQQLLQQANDKKISAHSGVR